MEDGTSQLFEGLDELLVVFDVVVESDDTNVFLTSALLSLDQSGGTVQTDDQTTSNLGIKGTRVTGLIHLSDIFEQLLDPGDDFVGRGVGGLIQIHNTVLQMFFDGSSEGIRSVRDGGVVSRLDVHLVVIL